MISICPRIIFVLLLVTIANYTLLHITGLSAVTIRQESLGFSPGRFELRLYPTGQLKIPKHGKVSDFNEIIIWGWVVRIQFFSNT